MSLAFFERFAWPVPRAFASAVSSARFEHGDVLYDSARAYESWRASRRGKGALQNVLQVLDPPRSARAAGEAAGRRFDQSWASPVTIAWQRMDAAGSERVETTQGRLFACLWHGEPDRFGSDSEAPPPPLLARELHGRLDECRDAVRAALPDAPACFAFALDEASDASLAKAARLRARVGALGTLETRILSPEAAGLEAGAFHPALSIQCLAARGVGAEPLHEALERALYGPVSSEGAKRFQIARHGLLLTRDD